MRFHWRALGLVALLSTGCAGAAGTGAALAPAAPRVAMAVAPADHELLAAGAVLTEPLEFERGDLRYVGGVSRAVVPVAPEQVLAALADVSALEGMLPRTKRASLVETRGATRVVELVQGNAVVEARYSVELAPAGAPGELRFHMDASRPHDIDDVYGYFKVEPFGDGRSLVTVAAAVDVGSGLSHLLFGRPVQNVILSAPYTVRQYFAAMEASGARAVVASNAR